MMHTMHSAQLSLLLCCAWYRLASKTFHHRRHHRRNASAAQHSTVQSPTRLPATADKGGAQSDLPAKDHIWQGHNQSVAQVLLVTV